MSKATEQVRAQILETLADGQFHSGELIGEALGMSRAAVSKHMKLLGELGLDVFCVTGKGYKLAHPLALLDKQQILSHYKGRELPTLDVFSVVDSTNQYLKDNLSTLENGHTCLAEAQTAGRGRHGRKWVSPYGASLYLSMYWGFPGGYQSVSGLSLAIGVAIADAIQDYAPLPPGAGPQLKWPNDIYIQGRKLAGVLIEVEGQMGAGCDCVLGVGLNIDLPVENDIDQPWTDLQQVHTLPIDRNRLCALLLEHLNRTLRLFQQHGLAPFSERWRALDIYRDKGVKLIIGQQTIRGISRGINESGALLVEVDGKVNAYHGGEISVRPE